MPNHIYQRADKGSAVVVWDRDDYIQEAEKQLGDKEIYEEVSNDPQPLIDTIHKAVEKIRKRGDLSADNIKYFMVKDPKFARFYLLPKIHKRLENVPERPEGLSALQKRLELRRYKEVSTSTLVEPAEIVLKNNVFIFGKKNL